jgi:hypothetical protein
MSLSKPDTDHRCECGGVITHLRVKLCTQCYASKRKTDWIKNEKLRQNKDLDRKLKRNEYSNKMYYEHYRHGRLVRKQCECGRLALKGSKYSLCKSCSDQCRSKNKTAYQKNRKKKHLPTRVRENIKARLKTALTQRKSDSIVEYLGCSMDDYMSYLESKFQEGMSWDNYGKGGWHIDHVIPLKTDYSDMSLHNYTNTQPIWEDEHFEKTARENRRSMSTPTE